jgi:hypothetical protein
MHMRRCRRLTNAHSKKLENHCHMVALYTVWYNFVRINGRREDGSGHGGEREHGALKHERYRGPNRR